MNTKIKEETTIWLKRLKYFKNRDKKPIRKEDLDVNNFAMSDDGGDFGASSSEEIKAAQDKIDAENAIDGDNPGDMGVTLQQLHEDAAAHVA